MIFPQTYLEFPQPVTLQLRVFPRNRVVLPENPDHAVTTQRPFTRLPILVQPDVVKRYILATLPPIGGVLVLYGPEDFAAACADSMDEHAERAMAILGDNPAEVLQQLIDGTAGEFWTRPPPPKRVPKTIENWRARVILGRMGLTDTLEAKIAALPDELRALVDTAWNNGAALRRQGEAVNMLGTMLSLSPAQLDTLFIEAAAVVV